AEVLGDVDVAGDRDHAAVVGRGDADGGTGDRGAAGDVRVERVGQLVAGPAATERELLGVRAAGRHRDDVGVLVGEDLDVGRADRGVVDVRLDGVADRVQRDRGADG